MQPPTSLGECVDISLKIHYPVQVIAEAYEIRAPDYEVDSVIAERLAKCRDPFEIRALIYTSINTVAMRRMIERFRREYESEEDPAHLEEYVKFFEESASGEDDSSSERSKLIHADWLEEIRELVEKTW